MMQSTLDVSVPHNYPLAVRDSGVAAAVGLLIAQPAVRRDALCGAAGVLRRGGPLGGDHHRRLGVGSRAHRGRIRICLVRLLRDRGGLVLDGDPPLPAAHDRVRPRRGPHGAHRPREGRQRKRIDVRLRQARRHGQVRAGERPLRDEPAGARRRQLGARHDRRHRAHAPDPGHRIDRQADHRDSQRRDAIHGQGDFFCTTSRAERPIPGGARRTGSSITRRTRNQSSSRPCGSWCWNMC